jgi:endonuclease YncB( thermonuclease family)
MPFVRRAFPRSVHRGLRVVLVGIGLAVVARFWPDGPSPRRDHDAVEAPAVGRLSGRPRVIDGDGLEIDGIRLRLAGIDAPERAQTCRIGGRETTCGETARDRLADLVAGRVVVCDWGRLDKWRRPLARCRIGDLDLAAAMVRDGWAVAYGGHEAEEADARAARRGLWAGSFAWPEDWRRDHPRGRAERSTWSWPWSEDDR